MLDTVECYIPIEELTNVEQLDSLRRSLKCLTTYVNNQTGATTEVYKVGDISIRISEKNIRIKNLSLPNYYYGTNSRNMPFEETKSAFQKLEKELNLPILKGYVTRVDIAWNFPVSQPTKQYLDCLKSHSQFKRVVRDENSIAFQQKTKRKEIICYDKLVERRDKNRPIYLDDDCINCENLFRYEFRFLKQPHKLLGKAELTVADLTNSYIQKELLKVWYEAFRKIQKVDFNINYEITPPKSAKQFIETYALYSIINNQQFYTYSQSQISNWYSSNTIKRSTRDQIKLKQKYLINNTNNYLVNTDDKGLVEELNTLVYSFFSNRM